MATMLAACFVFSFQADAMKKRKSRWDIVPDGLKQARTFDSRTKALAVAAEINEQLQERTEERLKKIARTMLQNEEDRRRAASRKASEERARAKEALRQKKLAARNARLLEEARKQKEEEAIKLEADRRDAIATTVAVIERAAEIEEEQARQEKERQDNEIREIVAFVVNGIVGNVLETVAKEEARQKQIADDSAYAKVLQVQSQCAQREQEAIRQGHNSGRNTIFVDLNTQIYKVTFPGNRIFNQRLTEVLQRFDYFVSRDRFCDKVYFADEVGHYGVVRNLDVTGRQSIINVNTLSPRGMIAVNPETNVVSLGSRVKGFFSGLSGLFGKK